MLVGCYCVVVGLLVIGMVVVDVGFGVGLEYGGGF